MAQDEIELRILAAQRAIVELSAVAGSASRAKALESLRDEMATAIGDERLVLQEAVDLIQDGKMRGDALALAGWIRR